MGGLDSSKNNKPLQIDKNEKINYSNVPDYSGYCPNCPVCGITMGYDYFGSEFHCSGCGHVMDENDWEYEFNCNDPSNPLYGCEACGGPWPQCKSSCKLFDD